MGIHTFSYIQGPQSHTNAFSHPPICPAPKEIVRPLLPAFADFSSSKDINKVPGIGQSYVKWEQGGDVCGFICYLKPPDSPFKLDREKRLILKGSWAVRKMQPLQLGNSWKREMPFGGCQLCGRWRARYVPSLNSLIKMPRSRDFGARESEIKCKHWHLLSVLGQVT